MKIIFFIFLYPFFFKPSSFARISGASDLNFFSSTSLYPSLLPFFNRNFLIYFDYRKPYEIDEWKEINIGAGIKRTFGINIFQKRLNNYSETEILFSLSKKFFKKYSISLSLNYLSLNSILKKYNKFDISSGFSILFYRFIFSFNYFNILNSYDSKNYYISLNFFPFDKFSIFASMERESKKAGFYLLLKPMIILISFSKNFLNTGFGLVFDDKSLIFSFEDNSYLGLSTGVSLEFKR